MDQEKGLTSVGEIFGNMRSERDNTQDYYCGNRISRKTLWNFEHDLSNISYDSYLYLLDKINVSPSNMDYLYSKNNKNKLKENPKFIKQKYRVARTLGWRNASQKKIEGWIEESAKLFQETQDSFYINFSFSMRKILRDKFLPDLDLTKEINYVTDYLMKIEIYSDLDLAMFVNFLEYIQEPLIFSVERELRKRFLHDPTTCASFSYYYILRLKYLFRLNDFEKNKKELNRYLKVLKECVDLVGNICNVTVLYNFFYDLYCIKSGETENVGVNHHLEILRYFERFDEYADCYSLLNQVLFGVSYDKLNIKKVPFII